MLKLILLFLLTFLAKIALGITNEERHEFLDAIRPQAARMAGQPVRFKVDKINYDKGWIVLFGELLAQDGKVMDWRKAVNCDSNLDKSLWVVAKKGQQGWQVKEMFICSPEPPYWYLNPKVAFDRPCGIYTGLEISGDETAEQQCRAYVAKKRSAKH